MIQAENIQFGYKFHEVFAGLSVNFEAGKIYGLLGKNGEGKSTLFYLLCGLLRAKEGKVIFKGKDMQGRPPSALEDMFIVPEEFDLPKMPLCRFVEANACFYPKFSSEVFLRCLDGFELGSSLDLGHLSMGDKKKVYISFALAAGTSLLLLDEPTNGLDIPSKSQFRKVIASCMDDAKAIVISTHQVRDVENLIDHIMVLNRHKLVFDRSTQEISQRLAFSNGQVLLQEGGMETRIDVEALFLAIVNGSDVIGKAFV